MNNIRKENLKNNRNADENFFVVDEGIFNSTYLSVLFIVNKDKKISKEALGLTSVLLSISSFANADSSSSHRKKISFEFGEGYNKYTLCCAMREPIKSQALIDSRLKLGKRLMRTFSSGWSGSERDFSRAIEEISYRYAVLDNDPIFQLDRLMQLNFLPDLPLGKYPYGNLEKIKKLNHLDIKLALEHVLASNRMVAYVGDTNYRFVLSAKNSIKPSIKIFPLSLRKQILPRGTNLEVKSEKIAGNYLGFAFNLSKVHSEKVKLCHDILLLTLFNKYSGVMNDFLLANGARVIDTKLFLTASCFCVYLSTTEDFSKDFIEEFERRVQYFYKEDFSDYLSISKDAIEKTIDNQFDSPKALVDHLYEGRLAGLDYSPEVLKSKLKSISREDFEAYLKKINLIGSIKLEGYNNER